MILPALSLDWLPWKNAEALKDGIRGLQRRRVFRESRPCRSSFSTSVCSRPSASSHCAEISLTYCCTSASRLASMCHILSRPCRVARARPASESTRRCLAIAWREMPVPSVSREMDSGPSRQSLPTSPSRVASPSAVNNGAASINVAMARPRDTMNTTSKPLARDIFRSELPGWPNPARSMQTPRHDAPVGPDRNPIR